MIAKVAKKAKSRPKFKSLCTAKELKQFEKVASRPSHPGEMYALVCLQGKIPCGEYALRAMKRHFLDLIKSEKKAYPYRFDRDRAEHTLKFFSFMRHSRAEWAGQPLKLDPWQQFIIWCVFGWVGKKTGHRRFRTAYIEIPRKNGKALSLNTPIPTPEGWKMMGELTEGDQVYDEKGKPCRVVFCTDVMLERKCYQVYFSDNTSIIADAEHLWFTDAKRTGLPRTGLGRKSSWEERHIRTTEEIAKTLYYDEAKREMNHAVPCCGALHGDVASLPIPPYTLGAWLGDGHTNGNRITCGVHDQDELLSHIVREGVEVRKTKDPINFTLGTRVPGKTGSFQAARKQLGINEKFIPSVYLRASIEQRQALLRGLMDTDGTISKSGQCSFSTTKPLLRDGVLELIRSLGYKPTIDIRHPKLKGWGECATEYRIQFWAYQGDPVFGLKRKQARLKPRPTKITRASRKKIVAVTPVDSVPVRCIQVDSPSKLYLAGLGMTPTHNTTMAAGVAAYLADADGEMGAEVFCVGADESQSLRCFNEIKFSVRKSPELAKRFRPFKDIITIDDTNSFIRPVAHNPDAIHGQNPSGAIIDETHKHKNDEVFDAMDGGRGARREPLLWCISTAGNRQEGIGYELNARARTCLDAVGTKWDPDERFFTIIYSADQGDDSFDELTWRKANPGFGISVKPEYLEEQMRTAKQNARKKRRFEQDHLNIWSQEYSKWLDVKLWDACAGKVPLKRFAREQIPLYVGGDLAARQDMCAIVACWRYEKHFYIKPWFWITRESLEIQRPIRTQLMQWAEDGLIHVEDSRIIDQGLIHKRLKWLARHFNLQAVALDPTNAAWMMKRLDHQGITVVEYTQKPSFFAQPCKLLEDTLAEEGLSHGGNPVLRWQAANVVVKTMDSGYVHVVKKAAREQTAGQKIDGIIAMLQALGVWQKINGEDDDMVYNYESGSAKL